MNKESNRPNVNRASSVLTLTTIPDEEYGLIGGKPIVNVINYFSKQT